MTPEAWTAVATISTSAIGTVGLITIAYFQYHQHQEIKKGRQAAEKAVENTENIANGFADDTATSLHEAMIVAKEGNTIAKGNQHTLTWVVEALTRHLTYHDAADSVARPKLGCADHDKDRRS